MLPLGIPVKIQVMSWSLSRGYAHSLEEAGGGTNAIFIELA